MEARQPPDQRKAEPQDAAALISVLEEASSTYGEWAPAGWRGSGALPATQRDELPERLTRRDWWGRVAEAGDEAVGYVIVGPAVRDEDRAPIPGMLHLWHLFVRPAWWGSGVAADLLSAALGEAAQRGYEAARLRTPRDNARARAFYRREGWRETGAEIYAPKLDLQLVEYRRTLRP